MSQEANIIRLLESESEKSIALGLVIHHGNPSDEIEEFLERRRSLYNTLFDDKVNEISANHLYKLNRPVLQITGQKFTELPLEICTLTNLRELWLFQTNLKNYHQRLVI